MIPHPWEALVLVMAAYRWTRLGGWDDWPPIYKIRAWAIGERWVTVQVEEPSLPGKTPESEVAEVRPAYDRPLLAHLVHCPWCLGWWVSLATYAAWLILPESWVLYAAAPFALSSAVGFMAKNWDP